MATINERLRTVNKLQAKISDFPRRKYYRKNSVSTSCLAVCNKFIKPVFEKNDTAC